MQEERIKYLINRYYQGLSTEGEETELRKFFSKNSLPGFEAERVIFSSMDEFASVPEPSVDFEKKIYQAIDESGQKSIKPKQSGEPNLWTKTMFINIAAVALTLIGTYIFFTNYEKPVNTYKDPQIAYNETVKIFNMVSDKLNTGLNSLEPLTKVNKVTSTSLSVVDNSVSVITGNLDLSKRIN